MARGYSTQGPQMAILAVVAAACAGFFWGHSKGSTSEKDDIARLLRREEVSEACREQVNRASSADYWHQDAKNEAFRGYSRY